MDGPLVRDAEPADAAGIRRVARESWHAAYDDIVGPAAVDETVDEWYDLDGLRESTTRPGHEFLVATRDDPVGFVHVAPLPDREDAYRLSRIYVAPDEWGGGVGSRLLDRAERRIRDRGIERLRLDVFSENEVGVGFYESRGFERIDERYSEAFETRESVYEKEL